MRPTKKSRPYIFSASFAASILNCFSFPGLLVTFLDLSRAPPPRRRCSPSPSPRAPSRSTCEAEASRKGRVSWGASTCATERVYRARVAQPCLPRGGGVVGVLPPDNPRARRSPASAPADGTTPAHMSGNCIGRTIMWTNSQHRARGRYHATTPAAGGVRGVPPRQPGVSTRFCHRRILLRCALASLAPPSSGPACPLPPREDPRGTR